MTAQPGDRATAPGAGAAGSIYDLGYQHYAGPRLGRRAAFTALYADSLRACFGLSRPGRAKIVPIGLLALALVPAIIAVAVDALLAGVPGGVVRNPIRYDTYFGATFQIVVLFVAAQAPELLGRDQRHHVLALYFSRALKRHDYALAKLAALISALLLLLVLPQAVIFTGKILGGSDIAAAFGDNLSKVPAILLSSVAAAVVLASIALAIASFTPRRAYATAGIFAFFYITIAVAAIGHDAATGDLARYILLVAPTNVLVGLTAWGFATQPSAPLDEAAIAGQVYLGAAVVMAVVAIVVLLRRYARIPA
jgi:ABC-2 type transport system permease protein